jgi:hypothetical protein
MEASQRKEVEDTFWNKYFYGFIPHLRKRDIQFMELDASDDLAPVDVEALSRLVSVHISPMAEALCMSPYSQFHGQGSTH